MEIISVLTLLFFQISMLLIAYFIVAFSIDWFKRENVVGKIYITIIASCLTIACVSLVIAIFLKMLQML